MTGYGPSGRFFGDPDELLAAQRAGLLDHRPDFMDIAYADYAASLTAGQDWEIRQLGRLTRRRCVRVLNAMRRAGTDDTPAARHLAALADPGAPAPADRGHGTADIADAMLIRLWGDAGDRGRENWWHERAGAMTPLKRRRVLAALDIHSPGGAEGCPAGRYLAAAERRAGGESNETGCEKAHPRHGR